MECLECGNNNFVEREKVFFPNVKGKTYQVKTLCWICANCGDSLMDIKQMNLFYNATKEKHTISLKALLKGINGMV